MTDIRQIALDTLKSGAPGLSEQTREVLAGIIARKAALRPAPVASGGQHSSGETIEQRFPALNDHLIRMASSGNTGSLTEWGAFFECLRAALKSTAAQEGGAK